MNENVIDFGEIKVPTSWNEINLKKFQEIKRFYENENKSFDVMEVLHILTDKSKDEISQLPSDFLSIIMNKMDFLQKEPEVGEASNKIEINGETYQVNIQNKLKVGEYIAADTTLKQDPNNIAAILAIVCRKPDEPYDAKFENEIFEDRMKMFEEQPVTKILPIIGFFLNCYMLSKIPSQLSTKVEETLNLIQQNIDNSPKIGAWKRFVLRRRVKTLLKSLKSIKCILMISYIGLLL
ncbi:MAG: hypothetical protein J6Y78_01700 [Paludibacteraceae bacterium]|nr:hypothetical protein [Paludibacteraceae bacterium]